MKPTTIAEFFQLLPASLDRDAAEDVTVVYQFDLSGGLANAGGGDGLAPGVGGFGGPHDLACERGAGTAFATGKRRDRCVFDAKRRRQLLQGVLRMLRSDRIPAFGIECCVEAGQHDGTLGQRRDGVEQIAGRRNGAGGAGGEYSLQRGMLITSGVVTLLLAMRSLLAASVAFSFLNSSFET